MTYYSRLLNISTILQTFDVNLGPLKGPRNSVNLSAPIAGRNFALGSGLQEPNYSVDSVPEMTVEL